MAWTCSGRSNVELIANLRREGLIHSSRVADAMSKVDRKAYCPDPRSAYQDSPQTIGYSATISAPHMHAHAAEELLDYLKPGSSVLDVGSGSGYLCAVLHHLVKPPPGKEGEISGAHTGSRVIGVEHIEPLVKRSIENLKDDGLEDAMQRGQIEVVHGDGRKGEWREDGGYRASTLMDPTPVPLLATRLALKSSLQCHPCRRRLATRRHRCSRGPASQARKALHSRRGPSNRTAVSAGQ